MIMFVAHILWEYSGNGGFNCEFEGEWGKKRWVFGEWGNLNTAIHAPSFIPRWIVDGFYYSHPEETGLPRIIWQALKINHNTDRCRHDSIVNVILFFKNLWWTSRRWKRAGGIYNKISWSPWSHPAHLLHHVTWLGDLSDASFVIEDR